MNAKRNKLIFLLTVLFLQSYILTDISSGRVFAQPEENFPVNAEQEEAQDMPALIQATTLEGDYKALTSLGMAFTPLAPQKDPGQAYENILCSCVRVQVEGHYGSGSIYKMLENEIIIVTNRHVLQYWNEDSSVTFFNGAVSTGNLAGLSDEADLGFVSIPAGNFTYEELLKYRNVRIPGGLTDNRQTNRNEEMISEGSGMFFVDMASEWRNPVKVEGEVIHPMQYLEDFQMEMLYGKGNVVPGMSGCGVFDDYGNYVGMLTGGTLQGEIAAVPVRVIEKEYKRYIDE